jgi:hypothetical protein
MTELIKPEVTRRYAKYVFLDVIQFSKRSAEAQSEIVHQLNGMVRQSLELHQVREDDCILIPTGDGMCLALISPNLPYDVHIQVALSILVALDGYNKTETNESRQFQIRMDINQNTDILVSDINERKNIAGAGINMASRIMDKADGSQVLVSQTVYEELQPSEQYMDKFKSFSARAKHGLLFRVYQYTDERHGGLNCETPSEFVTRERAETKLTKKAAFYLAHPICQKQFIVGKQGGGQNNYSLVVLLWFLAVDSEGASDATEFSPNHPRIYGDGSLPLEGVFNYYNSIDFDVISLLAHFIETQVEQYAHCFEQSGYGLEPLFDNETGRQKLRTEWLAIWNEFELYKCV